MRVLNYLDWQTSLFMTFSLPLKFLAGHLAAVLLAAFCIGEFRIDGLLDAYGFLALPLAAIDILITIGLAFTKDSRKYIPALLLCAAILIITGLFALSQVTFSR